MTMYFVGIDISKYKHDCCIISAANQKVVSKFTFKNDKSGFEQLNLLLLFEFAILPQPVPAPYFSGVFSGKTRRMHIQYQKYLSGMAYSVFKELRKVLFSLTLTLI